jgi:hypothetical protein
VTFTGHLDAATLVTSFLQDDETRARIAARGADTVRTRHTYVRRLEDITARLEAFVRESRAWPFWERFVDVDPPRALRFVEALRADGDLLREDLWHAAEATAHMKLGRWDAARRSTARARDINPALRRLPDASGR